MASFHGGHRSQPALSREAGRTRCGGSLRSPRIGYLKGPGCGPIKAGEGGQTFPGEKELQYPKGPDLADTVDSPRSAQSHTGPPADGLGKRRGRWWGRNGSCAPRQLGFRAASHIPFPPVRRLPGNISATPVADHAASPPVHNASYRHSGLTDVWTRWLLGRLRCARSGDADAQKDGCARGEHDWRSSGYLLRDISSNRPVSSPPRLPRDPSKPELFSPSLSCARFRCYGNEGSSVCHTAACPL